MASTLRTLGLGLVAHGVAGASLASTERQQSLESAWSKELSNDKTGEAPIKRVIGLIQKMKAELEAEAAKEAEMYDKMVCWCETGEKEKTKAIADADATMIDLESEIQARAAKVGNLAAEIENLKKQIAEDTSALKTAEAIREKEAAEFRSGEKDLKQAAINLGNAVAVLGKVQLVQGSKSFLQLGAPMLSSLRVVLRDVALKHETLMARSSHSSFVQVFNHKDLLASLEDTLGATETEDDALPLKFAERVLEKSVPVPSLRKTSLLQTAPASDSYSSASNGIFGIMNQMLDEFKADLGTKQKDETKAIEDFKALKAAKNEQLTVGKEKLDTMEAEGAGNIKALSDAKENLGLTQEQRSADVEFLRNLKLTCGDLDRQWEKRSTTRAAEMKAISETLVILTDDDAHEQLKKGGVSLMQLSSSAMLARRSRAAQALRLASAAPEFDADDLLAAWHGRSSSRSLKAGPRAQLSTLAMTVQLDAFTKIKAMMDKLAAELKEQQAEEVKFKSYCQKEFGENEKAVYAKTEEKEDLEAKMDDLESLLKRLATDIAAANKQSADTQLEMKKASEAREGENAEFQTVVADQRATQEILKKALSRLEDFYKKGMGKAVLVQQVAQQTPPVMFNKQKDNAGASPVMGLLEQVIEDSVALVKESTETEYKAQADYEVMIKDSNALVKDLTASVTEKTKASAASKTEKGQAKSDHTSAVGELESLAAYEADLHGECDFVIANFEIRQKARLQEIEAIQQAKGILSGA